MRVRTALQHALVQRKSVEWVQMNYRQGRIPGAVRIDHSILIIPPGKGEFIGLKAAAAKVGFSKITLSRWCQKGWVPGAVQVNGIVGKWLIPVDWKPAMCRCWPIAPGKLCRHGHTRDQIALATGRARHQKSISPRARGTPERSPCTEN
jgi:hypothetical protein